jgi:cytochrome oxidase Cu insertion factor (SCO1/SenC/PrrC family)
MDFPQAPTCQVAGDDYGIAPMQPTSFEPVTPDPAKLRRTALILVGIMVLGGFLIIKSYEKMSVQQADDTRPALIHQIRKERDLTVIRQDGKTAALFDLRGKVVVVNCLSLANPEAATRSLAVMNRLCNRLAGQDVHLITLVIDPPAAEQVVGILRDQADQLSMSPAAWWLATTDEKTMHRFVKNELKASLFPHREAGIWTYDSSVFLLDRDGHLRRAVVPQQRGGRPYVATFDFDQAAEWDAKGVLTGAGTTNVQELERLLNQTIDRLLVEERTK